MRQQRRRIYWITALVFFTTVFIGLAQSALNYIVAAGDVLDGPRQRAIRCADALMSSHQDMASAMPSPLIPELLRPGDDAVVHSSNNQQGT